ncbi:hypothetical protein DFH09DRAFT_1361128 [Mycena vulgaris]|nr:hypothetical protein DFH09DRAFT_1361128 [Mycena vulgaris]
MRRSARARATRGRRPSRRAQIVRKYEDGQELKYSSVSNLIVDRLKYWRELKFWCQLKFGTRIILAVGMLNWAVGYWGKLKFRQNL